MFLSGPVSFISEFVAIVVVVVVVVVDDVVVVSRPFEVDGRTSIGACFFNT